MVVQRLDEANGELEALVVLALYAAFERRLRDHVIQSGQLLVAAGPPANLGPALSAWFVDLMDDFRHEISYFFRPKGRGLVRKTVVFFLAETSTEKVTISFEHKGYGWFDFEEAIKTVTYPNARRLIREAETFVNEGKRAAHAQAG